MDRREGIVAGSDLVADLVLERRIRQRAVAASGTENLADAFAHDGHLLDRHHRLDEVFGPQAFERIDRIHLQDDLVDALTTVAAFGSAEQVVEHAVIDEQENLVGTDDAAAFSHVERDDIRAVRRGHGRKRQGHSGSDN